MIEATTTIIIEWLAAHGIVTGDTAAMAQALDMEDSGRASASCPSSAEED